MTLFLSWRRCSNSELVQPQLVHKAREFISQYKINLLRLVLNGSVAFGANQVGESSPRFEPSDLFLRLMAALRANSVDEFQVVVHEFAQEREKAATIPSSADSDP